MTKDTIREAIAVRAEQLGLTAYAISLQCDRSPSPETTKRFIAGRCSLNSVHVSNICKVLRLKLKPIR